MYNYNFTLKKNKIEKLHLFQIKNQKNILNVIV